MSPITYHGALHNSSFFGVYSWIRRTLVPTPLPASDRQPTLPAPSVQKPGTCSITFRIPLLIVLPHWRPSVEPYHHHRAPSLPQIFKNQAGAAKFKHPPTQTSQLIGLDSCGSHKSSTELPPAQVPREGIKQRWFPIQNFSSTQVPRVGTR